MTNQTTFPGKILLAGEFTVINGGDALALPIHTYYSKWALSREIDQRLIILQDHLSKLPFIDLSTYSKDISLGWYIQSNIPIGYGMGSSGAVSAAILSRFGLLSGNENIYELKGMLAEIEHSFHGKSSGFDPLISLLDAGILLKKGEPIKINMDIEFRKSIKNIKLLNSGMERNTIVPIKWFYEKMKEDEFSKMTYDLNVLNELLIHSIISFEKKSIQEFFKSISQIQFDYFRPLITQNLVDFWKEGLQSNDFFVKLCGKGGGGYYLVYINNVDAFSSIKFPLIDI